MTTTSAAFTILKQSHHAHEAFTDSHQLELLLKRAVRGEVRFDDGSRALYATDASNYRQVPIGLVVPRDAADVEATVAACRAVGAPILARGGGTSLAGQCCNVAVVIDFSKYLNQIVELDPAAKLASVQPGIVLDRVRDAAELHQLTFAPDPATHSRCTIGGMIGNNSCGVHGLLGGKTVDNIESLDVLLYDGTRLTVGATGEEELHSIVAAGGRRGQIYSQLAKLRNRYGSLIRQRFPPIPRRVSGYNLDDLLPENGFHIARSLVGSEGTCVTVLGANLRLTDSPPHRRLVALGFPDPFIAADHVPLVLEHKPIGLEGFDGMLVDFMLRKKLAVDDVVLLPSGMGHLLVELGAWSAEEVEGQVAALMSATRQMPVIPTARAYSPDEARRVWHVRESALGATVYVPGEPHGWEGWEDAAVPPAQLGRYLREIFGLMQKYGYRSPMYGHFGQGCVHLRINFDLESEAGIFKFREFLDRAADIVLAHGGSLSGEHGDGQARAALLPKMFGPELMQAFREFKAIWDPDNKMNPGKLVDPVAVYEPQENLRLGAGYHSHDRETYFRFPDDDGSLSLATLRCVGVGACRKQDAGTMCPSYMATREERHSTRGRAHLLWEVLEGNILKDGWKNEEVREALDLCLSCKACKSECPVNVDVATYKSEFLAHYYQGRFHPLRDYLFGFMDRWAALAAVLPGVTPRLANFTMQAPIVGSLIKQIGGIAQQRTLPKFASSSFQSTTAKRRAGEQNLPKVMLWPDTWNNNFYPPALRAAQQVLTAAGFDVEVPRGHICCGRPLYDFGFLSQARRYLINVMAALRRQIDDGTPIVVLEPSCASVFRDELANLFPSDERATRLREQVFLLSEFLVRHAPGFTPPQTPERSLLVHGHCHNKSIMKMGDELSLLRATGSKVEYLDSGCCGMAGPFGFEKEKYSVSQTLGERVLMPAVRSADLRTFIVSDGFSCREQIAQNSTRRAIHFAEAICPTQQAARHDR
ncbi:Glycolate dehydrogenase [Acidisarcina polymorpha]|uniref:Glycolate dehydrogenase n=1 Tax=Acidisarcina polymorpha TaxID=2211140 RepID=A0A2Z5G7W4_9BACT|nr:FAD-binding and (Fe-S)-binding domain-containing protein [Acidisarcina polymorpha]AXC15363.1 Glycolate dehydrogenase [Acidisarcina polymorpha]